MGMNIDKILTISLIMTSMLTVGILSNPTSVYSQVSNSVSITLGAADEGNFEPFSPPAIDVAPGSMVTWTNEDSVPHTVTAEGTGEVPFDSGQIPPGMSWDNTFDSSGTFGYHCSIHPWMTGRVMAG